MPFDRHAFDEGELESSDADASARRFREFDCPSCSANNPYDDGFGEGDEVRCFYCGQELQAVVTASGRLRLREI